MEKTIKIYDLKDPQQYEDEREYWRSKTPEEKLEALEQLRAEWHKFNPNSDGTEPGFQRVFRIVERK